MELIDQDVKEIKRVTRKEKGKDVNTNMFILTFRKTAIPTNVKIYRFVYISLTRGDVSDVMALDTETTLVLMIQSVQNAERLIRVMSTSSVMMICIASIAMEIMLQLLESVRCGS